MDKEFNVYGKIVINVELDVKVTNTDNAPKRGRGRPKLDPSLLKTKQFIEMS